MEEISRHTKRAQTGDAWVVWFRRGQTYFRLRQMDKAILDFSQVLTMNPDHGPSFHGRGTACAELGDLEGAATDFTAALQRSSAPIRAWFDLAQARLHRNDASGYRESCARALKRFGETEDPDVAASLAWICSLAPAGTADLEQVVRLAKLALAPDAENYVCQRALGAALYRAGKFQEAVERFTIAMQMRKQPAPSAWLFLAMAHHRLGHKEDAQRWLDQASTWIKQARQAKPAADKNQDVLSWSNLPWNERLALELLHHEAEALMKGSNP